MIERLINSPLICGVTIAVFSHEIILCQLIWGPKYETIFDTDNYSRYKEITLEKVFFERPEKSIGKEKSLQTKEFIAKLSNELNIIAKLGRGKRLSLNLKSPDDTYNFASIQEDGEVWFYGIVSKTVVNPILYDMLRRLCRTREESNENN